MDKLKYIKIENEDGTLSDAIPIGAEAANIETAGGGSNLEVDLASINANLNAKETRINNLESKTNALSNGSPLPADGVEQMTDHNKIYVNTQDGYWYYFNNEEWIKGEIYQAVVEDKGGITYEELDSTLNYTFDDLQGNSLKYIVLNKYINTGNGLIVEYTPDYSRNLFTRMIKLPANNYLMEVDIGKYLNEDERLSTSINIDVGLYGETEDTLVAHWLAKIDNNSTLYATNLPQGYFPGSSLINLPIFINPINQNSTKRYFILPYLEESKIVCINQKISAWDLPIKIYKLDDINNIDILKNIFNYHPYVEYSNRDKKLDFFTLSGYVYKNDNNSASNGRMYTNNSTKYRACLYRFSDDDNKLYLYQSSYFYCITFDKKFKVKRTINVSYNATINDTTYKYNIIERQDDEEYIAWNMVLDADHSGSDENKAFLSSELINMNYSIQNIDGHPIEVSIDTGMKANFTNWYAIGDSITEKNYRAKTNYVDYCASDLNINAINLGKSGTGYKNTENTFIKRIDQINSYDVYNDIITVYGTINDQKFVSDSLGSLGDETTDTLYGSYYTFFKTLFDKFGAVRVGCISPIPWKGSSNGATYKAIVKALSETCQKFNVPFLDLSYNTNLRPDDTTFQSLYYLSDDENNNPGIIDTGSVHPNSIGHKLFYGRIKEFLLTL